MKGLIYVSHSKKIDYQRLLYKPITFAESLKDYRFVLPHEESHDEQFETKSLFKSRECKVVIAEVSLPATGQGIELGWANLLGIPIACIYQKGSEISGSLKVVSPYRIEYNGIDDMIDAIADVLKIFEGI